MEPVLAKCKRADFATNDFISNMPDNVIAEILGRMPIQNAVRTCALSKTWRFYWTRLTQLIFDQNFFEYLIRQGNNSFSWHEFVKVINGVLLLLKNPITKFVLYVPEREYGEPDVASINHWILFLSTKGSLKKFVLENMHKTTLTLPTHFFCCLELQHLVLRNARLQSSPAFSGFPNLITFECSYVNFECHVSNCHVLTRSTLLEKLVVRSSLLVPLAKNQKLKVVSLSPIIDGRAVFLLPVYYPKVEELYLDLKLRKFLENAGALRKEIPAEFHCLKTLQLHGIGFNDSIDVLYTFWLIHKSPYLQKLEIITVEKQDRVLPSAACPWEEGCTMARLHTVKLYNIKGLKEEFNLIKFLLASSPLLEKMEIIQQRPNTYIGYQQSFSILKDLLKFSRASPKAEIDLS